jgi:hypothetical protein
VDLRAGQPRGGGSRKFFAGLRERLIEYARREFALDAPAGDGHTIRQHLLREAEQTGVVPADLQGLIAPEGAEHVWLWFCQLEAVRTSNGYGPNPIAYGEIAAWAALTGNRPTRFEAACLRALDDVRLAEYTKQAEKRRKK